jgi:iron(III) transport system substrate-binding protein
MALVLLLAGCAPQTNQAPTTAATAAAAAIAPTQSGSPTNPTTVAEIAQYKGADRQQILEQRARQESGPLIIYSAGTIMRPLLDQFQQRYPFITTQIVAGDSVEMSRRVVEEYRAGRYDVDFFEQSLEALLIPMEQGVLQPYFSPELAAYPDSAKDPEGRWTIIRESYIGLGYNTNLLKVSDVPHSIRELADPKWQGKMAVNSSASTITNFLETVVSKEGEDFARGLKKQNFRMVEGSARVLADLIIAGEVALSPTIFNSHVGNSASKGAPIAWLPLEPVWNTANTFAIAAKTRHPAGVMLLGDYVLSRAGQEEYKKIGYGSQRTDMQRPETNFERVKLEPQTYEANFERSARLAQEIFYSGRN